VRSGPLGARDGRTLLSPGVFDCAILLAYHAGTGTRLMAHFNDFSGPLAASLKSCFDGPPPACPADGMTFTVAYNTNARRPCIPRLIKELEKALPNLTQVTKRGFGQMHGEGLRKKDMSIYLTLQGEAFASAP
jgi:hypothetical protein